MTLHDPAVGSSRRLAEPFGCPDPLWATSAGVEPSGRAWGTPEDAVGAAFRASSQVGFQCAQARSSRPQSSVDKGVPGGISCPHRRHGFAWSRVSEDDIVYPPQAWSPNHFS